MPAGALLDTSYLITLADPGRENHQTARRYWQHFTEEGIPIYLPTIVVSEFCIRQEIPPDILRACVVLPFNWDDAVTAASLDFSRIPREQDVKRDALKDDVKIIAQGIVKEAAIIITDDRKTFFKFAQELATSGKAPFRPIKLEDGFDKAFFDVGGGQRDFDDALSDDPEEAG